MRTIDNQNVIKLLGVKKSTKNFYLIMEYCNRGDLSKFLKKHKRFEENIVQSLIFQISNGLRALYKNHILHRDLKLSNLLITIENGQFIIKLADFGFAKMLNNSDEEVHTFCGTAPNMAPEILMGNKYNEKADLWSIGTIIFQLIAGYQPYEGKNPVQVLQSIMKCKYSYPSDIKISELLKNLINSLLQPDATKRIGWEEFFENPFIKTQPKDYINYLHKNFGIIFNIENSLENYFKSTNKVNTEHVSKPIEKSEIAQIMPNIEKARPAPTLLKTSPKKDEHKIPKNSDILLSIFLDEKT